MSLKEIVEPIYTQIFDRSARVENKVITAIDDVAAAGTFTLGSNGNLLSFKISDGAGANTALDIVSTSTADVKSSGAGARQVVVDGLFYDAADGNKRKPRNCVYNMNGTTIVNTGDGIASGTNLFCAVNKITVYSSGGSYCNTGDITAKATGTSTVFGILQATHYSSKCLHYATHHNEQLLVKNIHISSSMATACSIELFEQDLESGLKNMITKIFVGSSHSDILIPLNFKVGKQKVFYATIINLETVIGTNHIAANISAISI
tara:strand:- start:661 stop:1449 length:789 start_codon:yes stop_codon:yes gene_type:complete